MTFDGGINKLDSGTVVNESRCAMNVDSPQIRREDGQCERNFPGRRVTSVWKWP